MKVRPARPGDEAFILSLAPRFGEFELPPWLSAGEVAQGTAAQLRRALGQMNQRSTILVACEAEEPCGFVWLTTVTDFYTGRDVAKISEIAVAQDGQGAGSALMRASEAWARERGSDRVVLNVMEGNARARAFYARHGYAPEYTMLVKPLQHVPGNRRGDS